MSASATASSENNIPSREGGGYATFGAQTKEHDKISVGIHSQADELFVVSTTVSFDVEMFAASFAVVGSIFPDNCTPWTRLKREERDQPCRNPI